jgi:isoprenylcysteine carboxyl methyltransferase (ICMT) family protein YpbQ
MENNKSKLAFGKENYQLMIIGIVILIIGFVVMSMDKNTFGFGSLGLTVGPLIVLLGFIIEFFAILRKPKPTK